MTGYMFDQLANPDQVRQLQESRHRLLGMAYGLIDACENRLYCCGMRDISRYAKGEVL